MSLKKTTQTIAIAMLFAASVAAAADAPPVLSGGMGDSLAYPNDVITWYEDHQPILPKTYIEANRFIEFEPLEHYVDSVNWSLFSLKKFKKISKTRWFRLPEGSKIKRDPATGLWKWPVGSILAKRLQVQAVDARGHAFMKDVELRLERKIRDSGNPKADWALATFIDAPEGWKTVHPPEDLLITIERAISITGKPRNLSYNLTAAEACMTCHSRSAQSKVDLQRGSEFVYGANDELITGATAARSDRVVPTKQNHSAARVEKNRAIFGPFIEGPLPEIAR